MQRVISEIDGIQKEQWNEHLNQDILLTRIENLEKKVQVRQRSNAAECR